MIAKIGRTVAESTPAWPEPVRSPKGAPNQPMIEAMAREAFALR